MSHIPADLNQTMWDIADRRDARAADAFCEKFPALSHDLRTRMNLVSGMKGVRQAVAPPFVPSFRPQYLSKPKKWKKWAPAALALAAFASASYYVTQNILTPLPDPTVLRGPIPYKEPKANDDVRLAKPRPPKAKVDFDSDAPKPFLKAADERQPTGPKDSIPEPIRIQLQRVHLQNAISGIAARFDHKVEFPPNFPNPIIDVDLMGTDAMNFLNQMGNGYGFTAFDEGNGTIYLLLPSSDNAPPG